MALAPQKVLLHYFYSLRFHIPLGLTCVLLVVFSRVWEFLVYISQYLLFVLRYRSVIVGLPDSDIK